MKILFVLILALWAGIVRAGEIPDGFNGYPWGTSLAEIDSTTLGSFYLADSASGIHMASYQSPDSTFGGCQGVTCLISFTEGELTSVAITGDGYELFECLNTYLHSTYGSSNPLPPNLAKSENGEVKIFDTAETHALLMYDAQNQTVFFSLEEGITPHLNRMAKIFEKSGSGKR
jgi:hypothetical protein